MSLFLRLLRFAAIRDQVLFYKRTFAFRMLTHFVATVRPIFAFFIIVSYEFRDISKNST